MPTFIEVSRANVLKERLTLQQDMDLSCGKLTKALGSNHWELDDYACIMKKEEQQGPLVN